MAKIRIEVADSSCAGGEHMKVSVITPIGTKVLDMSKTEFAALPLPDEIELCARTFVRLIARQISGANHGLMRARVHGLEIDITPRAG